jgi:hypothetical protein
MPTFRNTLFHFVGAFEDGTECSEMLAFKLQTPVNRHPEESIQHAEHGESWKSRIPKLVLSNSI